MHKQVPHRSPFGLIQEDLYPSDWLILVSCMMLNCTSRTQVENVLPEFVKRWPTPEAFLVAKCEDVINVIASLGFKNRRTKNLFDMTKRFVSRDWKHASELPGIGVYAARAWEMFCTDGVNNEEPDDHALVQYFRWKVGLTRRNEQ